MSPDTDARVVILAGGLSPERDVSVRSGRRVAEALRRDGFGDVAIAQALQAAAAFSTFSCTSLGTFRVAAPGSRLSVVDGTVVALTMEHAMMAARARLLAEPGVPNLALASLKYTVGMPGPRASSQRKRWRAMNCPGAARCS